MKSKGEKERYKHLNAEFQRIARRDKKAFFNNQCKEIEENNRKGKTSNLFKKIRDAKGTFHGKMDTIKDRNGMDLTEAQDIIAMGTWGWGGRFRARGASRARFPPRPRCSGRRAWLRTDPSAHKQARFSKPRKKSQTLPLRHA